MRNRKRKRESEREKQKRREIHTKKIYTRKGDIKSRRYLDSRNRNLFAKQWRLLKRYFLDRKERNRERGSTKETMKTSKKHLVESQQMLYKDERRKNVLEKSLEAYQKV